MSNQRRRGGRRRRNADELEITGTEGRITDERNISCIDLTSTSDEEFVDLTVSNLSQRSEDILHTGANDASIVVIGSPNGELPVHRRRRPLPDPDDFDDLPPAPFEVPSPVHSSNAGTSNPLSPDPIKISCPVCLESDKEIKKGGSKLATTVCGHIFCQPCISDAVAASKQCPVCRKKMTLKDIVTLHI